jgi:hypothetical protein
MRGTGVAKDCSPASSIQSEYQHPILAAYYCFNVEAAPNVELNTVTCTDINVAQGGQ